MDYGGQDEYSVSDAPHGESGEEERQNGHRGDDEGSYEEPSPNSESQDEARPKSKVKAKAKFMPTNRDRPPQRNRSPPVKLTENHFPNDGDNNWHVQRWKKQRRGPALEPVTPERT